jgi:hypothetical protein
MHGVLVNPPPVTSLTTNSPASISAITTTNVTKLTFGPNAIVPTATLQSIGPGQWQAQFNFSSAGLPMGQGNVTLTLTATNGMGATVSLPIPLSLVNP